MNKSLEITQLEPLAVRPAQAAKCYLSTNFGIYRNSLIMAPKTQQIVKEETKSLTCLTFTEINPRDLKPSPKNNKIYKSIDREDPAIKELARDIAVNGVFEPLVVSADNFILSGHRRREAAIIAGLKTVPCRIVNVRHDDSEFIKMLVSYNNQRVKNREEQFREEIIKTNYDKAYQELIEYRNEKAKVRPETITVGERNPRKKISRLKSKMVEAATNVVNELKEFWPLSDRQIHYRLLNKPPLCNIKRKNSIYKNNRACYQDLCDLLTRLRLTGKIPMNAIADPTRPTTEWDVHDNPKDFVRKELDHFLKGYRRNLQQTQPLHIEVIAEKLTVESIIEPVCGKYNVPYTIGRGYGSLPSRSKIVQRFKRSGKDRLLLLILGDFDPEGVNIGESLLQAMREDFNEDNTAAVRVGLNPGHIERFNLHDNTSEAKSTSSRYKAFVQRYGKKVYELEALSPEQLQTILSEAIDSVLDVQLFNAELEDERKDATYLQAVRKSISSNTLDLLEDNKTDLFDGDDEIEF